MLALAFLLACSTPNEAPSSGTPTAGSEARAKAAPSGQADVSALPPVKSATGLTWYVLAEGSGPGVEAGQTVEVHYTGWLEDGTMFQSSHDRGKPIRFALGRGRVIKGWDEGLVGMKVGGKRQLHIPSALGYGPRGSGGIIPPDANLIFEVELVSVE